MWDPVTANDGQTYNRSTMQAIESEAKSKGEEPRPPLDRNKLLSYLDNFRMKTLIRELFTMYCELDIENLKKAEKFCARGQFELAVEILKSSDLENPLINMLLLDINRQFPKKNFLTEDRAE